MVSGFWSGFWANASVISIVVTALEHTRAPDLQKHPPLKPLNKQLRRCGESVGGNMAFDSALEHGECPRSLNRIFELCCCAAQLCTSLLAPALLRVAPLCAALWPSSAQLGLAQIRAAQLAAPNL